MNLDELYQEVRSLKERLSELNYTSEKLVTSATAQASKAPVQPTTMYGIHQAWCVSTIDPLKLGRVRYFSPVNCQPDTKVGGLPWASPVSNMGGFDDCGCFWVPPAGSRLLIMMENGDKNSSFYLGTTWTADRGPGGANFPYPIKEFEDLYQNKRGTGYLCGDDTGRQDMPPDNTESYNGFDYNTQADFEKDPDAAQKMTYSNVYVMKTPGKHYVKLVDGNQKCNLRWRRIEIMSSRGNWIMMKDDHLHQAGEWANPKCCTQVGSDASLCSTTTEQGTVEDIARALGTPLEKTSCNEQSANSTLERARQCANPYFKRKEECRPFNPGSEVANVCELPQSGIQIQALSGHQIVMDDSVDEPSGKPDFNLDFDHGCNNKFKGTFKLKSAHGHVIELRDDEDGPNDNTNVRFRSNNNYIMAKTASGNELMMNDDSLPGGLAGPERGIKLVTTSKNKLVMLDGGNEQVGPLRTDGGIPISKAKNGFITLETGYGQKLEMKDSFNQQFTDQQTLRLYSPQKDNTERGPHELLFAEKPTGPGLVMLRAGGRILYSSYDDSEEVVGSSTNPASKAIKVFGNYLQQADEVYLNKNKLAVFLSDQYILLGAGQDCKTTSQDNAQNTGNQAVANANGAVAQAADQVGTQVKTDRGPCFYPIIVAKDPWACPYTGQIHWTHLSMSERVLAS